MMSCVKIPFTASIAALIALTAIWSNAARAECDGEDGGAGLVVEITEGDTLILDDGRAVRLVGVLGPKRARSGPVSEARAEMEKAIQELTLGKRINLQLDGRKRDRYGRLLAQV